MRTLAGSRVRRTARAVVAVSLASCGPAVPSPSPVAPSAATLRDKAVHALVRERKADARRFASQAVAAPGGDRDAQARWVLAILDLEDCDAGTAAAQMAAAGSEAPGDFPFADAVEATRLALERYGRIEVWPAAGDDGARPRVLRLDATSPPLDPEGRRCVEAVRARLRTPVTLPLTLWLPAGEYRLSGGPGIQVEPGQTVQAFAPVPGSEAQ